MPNPTAYDLHVDQFLTDISIGYSNPMYIADQIFPIVPVQKQSNIVPKYDQSHWFRDVARLRAPGTRSQGGGWTVDRTDVYFCRRYSFRKEVADEDRDNADRPFDLDRDAALYATDRILLNRERNFAVANFTTGVWGTDRVGGVDFTQWSDYGNSSPLVDIFAYRDTVEGLIGREPTKLILGKQTWMQLKWHPDLIDLIKYTQRGVMSEDLFASIVEFPQVLIGKAIFTSSPEGTAEGSVTYSRVWGKNALMLYVPEAPSILRPSAGYTFTWERVPGSIQYVKRMRDEEREVDIFEVNSYHDQHVTAARAGLFMSNAVA